MHMFSICPGSLCPLVGAFNPFTVKIIIDMYDPIASLVAQLEKSLPTMGGPGFDPWVGKILWRRERLPTPVFWPRESHGLYSPWGYKESDMTERLLEKEMATHSSIPAWKIPRTEEPGRLQSTGSQRVGMRDNSHERH